MHCENTGIDTKLYCKCAYVYTNTKKMGFLFTDNKKTHTNENNIIRSNNSVELLTF